MDQVTIITVVSALLAAGSFVAFALPFLQRSDKREHYQNVIEKRQKDLLQATRESMKGGTAAAHNVSGRESMASFFLVQKLAGDMGDKVRSKLLQSGIRSPSAPLKFMIAKIVVPIVLSLFAMMILSSDKMEDVSNGSVLLTLFGAALFGFKLPDILIENTRQKRVQEISLAFPDSLDLMLICVQGGIGLEQTVARVAAEMADYSEVLAEELGILSAEMAMLNDRRQALQDFARRVGSNGAKSFATALIQAEQYGTSVSQAMRVISDELRDMRMAAAEEKAAALPPKLTVPMILFFLPALFVIILGPAGIEAGAAGVGQ